jgi:hypothetical protein
MKSPCCLSVRPLYRFEAVAQLQGNDSVNTFPAATNIHETIELLDVSFSLWPMSYQWKVGD